MTPFLQVPASPECLQRAALRYNPRDPSSAPSHPFHAPATHGNAAAAAAGGGGAGPVVPGAGAGGVRGSHEFTFAWAVGPGGPFAAGSNHLMKGALYPDAPISDYLPRVKVRIAVVR